MPDDPTGGYVENPRETKRMMTQDVGLVKQFMEGAEMLGTGVQVRRVAKPTKEDPLAFQEWWEVTVYDDPHLARDHDKAAT